MDMNKKRIEALTEWCEKWKVTAPQPGANFLDGFDSAVSLLSDEIKELKQENEELNGLCGLLRNELASSKAKGRK